MGISTWLRQSRPHWLISGPHRDDRQTTPNLLAPSHNERGFDCRPDAARSLLGQGRRPQHAHRLSVHRIDAHTGPVDTGWIRDRCHRLLRCVRYLLRHGHWSPACLHRQHSQLLLYRARHHSLRKEEAWPLDWYDVHICCYPSFDRSCHCWPSHHRVQHLHHCPNVVGCQSDAFMYLHGRISMVPTMCQRRAREGSNRAQPEQSRDNREAEGQ